MFIPSPEAYYSTILHELAHWTGSKKRLERIKGKKFGDDDYAFEELIAELTACFVGTSLGFRVDIENSSSYLDNWLKGMKNDRHFFLSACSKAQGVGGVGGWGAVGAEGGAGEAGQVAVAGPGAGGDGILGGLALQTTEGVTFEAGDQGGAGPGVAVAGVVFDGDEVVKGVVLVALAAAVEVGLFDQAVGGVPGEAVHLAVFVGQGLKASVGVVCKANFVAEGVLAFADLAGDGAGPGGGVTGRVGVADQQTGAVAGGVVFAPVRQDRVGARRGCAHNGWSRPGRR